MSAQSYMKRAYSARYGARHPLLVPTWRAGIYLIWRTLFSSLRPALFAALLIGAAALGLSAFDRLPRMHATPLSLEARIDEALYNALPDARDRRAFWLDALDQALNAPPRAAPDLPRARSFASAALAIEGAEYLALQHLAQGRRLSTVQAELRGRTAFARAQILQSALDEILEAGRAEGLAPPSLILAPPEMRARLMRAEALYGRALDGAESWFVDPAGRAITLGALPGLNGVDAILYGDVRDVLVQGCAMVEASGERVGQCRVGFLPKPTADPVLAGLALAVLAAPEEERAGARIIKAAYAAGRLNPQLAEYLAFGADAGLGREIFLAELMPILTQAGSAWTQPIRYTEPLSDAARRAAEGARVPYEDRSVVFAAFSTQRRIVGALVSLQVADMITYPDDAAPLALISETVGERLLAVHALVGRDVLSLARDERDTQLSIWDWPRRSQIELALSALCVLSALLTVLISVFAGLQRARGGPPGSFERMDAAVTRLILGKNS